VTGACRRSAGARAARPRNEGRATAPSGQDLDVRKALEAASEDDRRAALVEGLLEGGIDFVSELGSADEDVADEALQLLVGWLTGDRLTDRADEAERRWLAARTWRARQGGDLPVLDRFAAMANLALPPGHEERDRGFAARLLEEHLAARLAEGDLGEAIRTLATLLDDDVRWWAPWDDWTPQDGTIRA
jgi:hypothetical protein